MTAAVIIPESPGLIPESEAYFGRWGRTFSASSL